MERLLPADSATRSVSEWICLCRLEILHGFYWIVVFHFIVSGRNTDREKTTLFLQQMCCTVLSCIYSCSAHLQLSPVACGRALLHTSFFASANYSSKLIMCHKAYAVLTKTDSLTALWSTGMARSQHQCLAGRISHLTHIMYMPEQQLHIRGGHSLTGT